MKWEKKEIESLKTDWLLYKKYMLTANQLKERYKGRTIDALSRKYWKFYGRLNLPKEKFMGFVPANGGLFD
jgi:hypothetical protein